MKKQTGIINIIVLVIVALILIDYLKIDIYNFFSTLFSKENVKLVLDLIKKLFNSAINL